MKKVMKGVGIGLACLAVAAAVALVALTLWANGVFEPAPVSFRECEFVSNSVKTGEEHSEFSQYDSFRVIFELGDKDDSDSWGTLKDGQDPEDNVYYRARLFARAGQTEREIPLSLSGKKGTFILFDSPQSDPGYSIRFDLKGKGRENMIDDLTVTVSEFYEEHATLLTIEFIPAG